VAPLLLGNVFLATFVRSFHKEKEAPAGHEASLPRSVCLSIVGLSTEEKKGAKMDRGKKHKTKKSAGQERGRQGTRGSPSPAPFSWALRPRVLCARTTLFVYWAYIKNKNMVKTLLDKRSRSAK
jgi:hypothetical protein